MSESEQPICPYCGREMTRVTIKMYDGHFEEVWLCGCAGEDEEVEPCE